MNYTDYGSVIVDEKNRNIPKDPKNSDYQAFLADKKAVVTVADPRGDVSPSTDSIVQTFLSVISKGDVKTLDDLRANSDLLAIKAQVDSANVEVINANIKAT